MTSYNLFVFTKNKNYQLNEILNSQNLSQNLLQGNYIQPITYSRDGSQSVFKMGSTEIHFLKNDRFALRDDSIVPKYFEGKDYKMTSTSTSSNGLFDLVQVKSEGDNYLLLINYLINNTKLVVYELTSISEFSHNHKTGFSNLVNMTPTTREVTSISRFPTIEPDSITPVTQSVSLNEEKYGIILATQFDRLLNTPAGPSDWFGRNEDNTSTLSITLNNGGSRQISTVAVATTSFYKSSGDTGYSLLS